MFFQMFQEFQGQTPLCLAIPCLKVSTLADIAWRFPPRPPLSSELAVDMRSAPRPAAYVFASRRFFSASEWTKDQMPSEGNGSAARFTTTVAQEEATNDVAKVLPSLAPDRCRLTLWSTEVKGAKQRRRDANVGLEFAELRLDASLQHTWLAEPEAGSGGGEVGGEDDGWRVYN